VVEFILTTRPIKLQAAIDLIKIQSEMSAFSSLFKPKSLVGNKPTAVVVS